MFITMRYSKPVPSRVFASQQEYRFLLASAASWSIGILVVVYVSQHEYGNFTVCLIISKRVFVEIGVRYVEYLVGGMLISLNR